MSCFLTRPDAVRCQPWSAEIHLRFPITRPDLPARLGTTVDLPSTSIRGRPWRASYLPGCARQLLTVRCAHYAGGASLTTFGFVTIVPRYLLPQVIPSHSFAALTALVVRRENGNVALLVCRGNGLVDQPRLACTSRRTPSVGALACAPGGGTLPPALVVRRVKGFVDQPRLASTSRRTPPVGALACAPGSGTLPPHLAAAPCRLFYGICCFQQKAYSNYTKVGCDCQ